MVFLQIVKARTKLHQSAWAYYSSSSDVQKDFAAAAFHITDVIVREARCSVQMSQV
jgi:hypothetical protein